MINARETGSHLYRVKSVGSRRITEIPQAFVPDAEIGLVCPRPIDDMSVETR